MLSKEKPILDKSEEMAKGIGHKAQVNFPIQNISYPLSPELFSSFKCRVSNIYWRKRCPNQYD